ncbi:Bug family tripartite tricarboxylate transporter substrate binding protein [Falsiroseomonas selenitidurans]|uniref:Tripartite tricarboxylate transporter substrate binding protein n=1 Tax=Falsiroseomonas selenitidurans TaxID=2716335 RepID=A0ABX1EAV3_9PROT|nr:tripartite tricarboxylate transporter substrate binding protein [Falsiroseomonas selenitidurans]NKC34321.1 tripartite tricarboxylate transporter substrate binding protein [Falsiroseomonas selenitidurans]
MRLTRRAWLAAGLASLVVPPALAQASGGAAWPARPVRAVVPFPPGGAIDALARVTAARLAETLGQPFVVENRPGAGGTIGSAEVARAAPDGHTLLWVSTAHAVNPGLYPRLPYDGLADFAPVMQVARVPNVLVVRADLPAATVAEFAALARQRSGDVTYASAGSGTTIHIAGELFTARTGVQMTHVPYRGSAPALQDLLAGRVDAMFDSLTSALPQIRSGRLRALGVTTAERSTLLPEVPTIAEAGVAGYAMDPWFGLLAPARTPDAVLARIEGTLAAALAEPATRDRLLAVGLEPIALGRAGFAAVLARETAEWTAFVRQAGIRVE